MKKFMPLFLLLIIIASCKTIDSPKPITNEREESLVANDTVVIGSDENTYEIIIIDPGFNAWLRGTARPRQYYSQSFLEGRNEIYVANWNIRVNQPQQFDPNLYQMQIDYSPHEDYGYEINYKLYNYFIYFQLTYKQRLGPFVPRI
ncbi:MAG: hypothetical protein HKP48_01085 [Winogradskyella sp.]|uniref:DUF6146 family protein n=1 Tax=Winogradskyella sp. TaxID=1883156 RepID=UPI0017D80AAD|nr:DUF6146 family protein [Winogradskyella sp.]MBT8245280.1 hypothetical protein [Winogradskyella sp.]NNK21911.1 hypothetical protein [Winogradskyella sp.]